MMYLQAVTVEDVNLKGFYLEVLKEKTGLMVKTVDLHTYFFLNPSLFIVPRRFSLEAGLTI
jgi:hypothetical protein